MRCEVCSMLNETVLQIIQKKGSRLKKPVRLVVFTSDRGCDDACPGVVELACAIKTHLGKIALEMYDTVMDRDKSEQYGIQRVPALVVQEGEGQAITFYGLPEHVFLEVFLNAIDIFSETTMAFPDNILHSLQHLARDVTIRVFVTNDSSLCKTVAETAIGFAHASSYIHVDIITSDFPELIQKHHITMLPKTIFGENLHRDGAVSESEFLELIFQAEGVKPGPDRRCLLCTNSSVDILCPACKTRIQAEALDHKLQVEKQKKRETS